MGKFDFRTDLDCGQRVWYMRPSFYLTIVWGIFSLACVIFGSLAAARLRDPFFPKACSAVPGNLMIAMLFFFILSILAMLWVIFPIVPEIEVLRLGPFTIMNLKVFANVGCSTLFLFLLIGEVIKYGTQDSEVRFHAQGVLYYHLHPKNTESIWFADKTACEEGEAMVGECAKYFDYRGTKITGGMLGISVPWFLLNGYLVIKAMTDELINGVPYAAMVDGKQDSYTA